MKTHKIGYKVDKYLYNMVHKYFNAIKCSFSSKYFDEKYKINQKNQLFLKIDYWYFSKVEGYINILMQGTIKI